MTEGNAAICQVNLSNNVLSLINWYHECPITALPDTNQREETGTAADPLYKG